jgi:hypothetical protein
MGKVTEVTLPRSHPIFKQGLIVFSPTSSAASMQSMKNMQTETDSLSEQMSEQGLEEKPQGSGKQKKVRLPSTVSGGSDFMGMSGEEIEGYVSEEE